MPSLADLDQRVPTPDKECGCPDYAVQHAHFEGQILAITDDYAAARAHKESCRCHSYDFKQYKVLCGNLIGLHPCGCGVRGFDGAAIHGYFSDLPSAQAEFDKRNLALMGREEE